MSKSKLMASQHLYCTSCPYNHFTPASPLEIHIEKDRLHNHLDFPYLHACHCAAFACIPTTRHQLVSLLYPRNTYYVSIQMLTETDYRAHTEHSHSQRRTRVHIQDHTVTDGTYNHRYNYMHKVVEWCHADIHWQQQEVSCHILDREPIVTPSYNTSLLQMPCHVAHPWKQPFQGC